MSGGRIKKQPELSPFPAFQRKPDITPTNDGGCPTCHRSTSASLGPHLCAGHPGAVPLSTVTPVSAACPESGPDKLVVAESFSRASSRGGGVGGGAARAAFVLVGWPSCSHTRARRMRKEGKTASAECSCLQRTCRQQAPLKHCGPLCQPRPGEFWGSALGL